MAPTPTKPDPLSPEAEYSEYVRAYARRHGLPETPEGYREAEEHLDTLGEFFRILLQWDRAAKERAEVESTGSAAAENEP